MYKGYLIKKNGIALPLENIQKETYSTQSEDVIESEFKDGNNNNIMFIADKQDKSITFTTKYLREEDKSVILSFFNEKSFELEYFNTITGEYETGLFYRPTKLEVSLHRTMGTAVLYKPIKIELKGV